MHNKPNIRKSWDFRGHNGFNIGPALNQYRCFHVVDSANKSLFYSNTVEFLHDNLSQPTMTKSDRIVHVLNFLSCSIKDAPSTIHHEQLTAISNLRKCFSNWIPRSYMEPPTPSPAPPTQPSTPAPNPRSPPSPTAKHKVSFRLLSGAGPDPKIASTTRLVTPPPRVVPRETPPPRVVPI